MPQLSSTTILKRRHLVLLVTRALAIVMVVFGSVHIIQAVGSALGSSLNGSSFWNQLASVYNDNYNPFWYGLSFVGVGVALGWKSRALARWVVPITVNECPACGYTLQHLSAKRCPECGYELAAASDAATSD